MKANGLVSIPLPRTSFLESYLFFYFLPKPWYICSLSPSLSRCFSVVPVSQSLPVCLSVCKAVSRSVSAAVSINLRVTVSLFVRLSVCSWPACVCLPVSLPAAHLSFALSRTRKLRKWNLVSLNRLS